MADIFAVETLEYRFASVMQAEPELALWRKAGVRPRLWWRDDDTRAPTAQLDRLIALAAGRPLALAVIPDGDLGPLARRLERELTVVVGQHGVDHINRRPPGEKPSEFILPPTTTEICERVALSHGRMMAAGLQPAFYTPPWNAVDPGLGKAVQRVGIGVLSAGAAAVVHSDLIYLSAEIDVIAWKNGARFKGARRVMSALARALEQRRRAGDFGRPIGLLTHHLAHDDATWRFLDWAMGYFDTRFAWVAVDTADRPMAHLPMARGQRV